jgi:mRNA interferase RelE/StbE
VTYAVTILRPAQKRLAKLDARMRNRIASAIHALADNPRPPDCKKLVGRPAWRIRVGTYRVIYEIQDSELLVLVVTIAHRREVYRKT